MSLEQLLKSLPPAAEVEVFPIDVTDIFGEVTEGEKTILHFRKPVTSDLFALTAIIRKVQFQFEDFPDDLAENIALMARCIQEKDLELDRAWLLLAHIVKRTEGDPQKFLTFKARFALTFPEAFNLAKAEADEKKNNECPVASDAPVSDVPAPPAGRTPRSSTRKRSTPRSV